MMFRKSPQERRVFVLHDDNNIGDILRYDDDATFDDSLSQRSPDAVFAGTFVGNFAARRMQWVAALLMVLLFGGAIARIGLWQVLHGNTYRAIADNNRTRTKTIIPDRGVITDRDGVILAWNTPVFHVLAHRADLPQTVEARETVFRALGDALTLSSDDFEKRYQDTGTDQIILLAETVPYTAALAFEAQRTVFPGITIELASLRTYRTDAMPTLSHVLGFTGSIPEASYDTFRSLGYRRFDSIGKQGVEQQYETLLRGTPGVEITEVNSQGKALRTLEKTDVIHGENLTLTIDAGLTAAIESIVEKKLAHAEVKKAAVVVSNPKNGEVLAIVSYPAYDVNLFARGITQGEYSALLADPNAPLFPRATQGEYPSGSTMKPIYAAAALIEHVITPSTSILSTGGIWLGNRLFPDWRRNGHGPTNVYHAIADSVNTFFYTIGGGTESFEGLGVDRLMRYASMFGFGETTGLEFPNEANGFLPSKAWKEATKGEPWYVGDTYNVSIGQGDVLVTPLQMNRATAVFANGGTLITPHLRKDDSQDAKKIIPDDVAAVIKDAMRETVTNGSSIALNTLSQPVAGKTGTAQWATGRDEHTWFTGFGPFNDPTLTITVVVEEGGANYYATPIAGEIFEWYFQNRDVK